MQKKSPCSYLFIYYKLTKYPMNYDQLLAQRSIQMWFITLYYKSDVYKDISSKMQFQIKATHLLIACLKEQRME